MYLKLTQWDVSHMLLAIALITKDKVYIRSAGKAEIACGCAKLPSETIKQQLSGTAGMHSNEKHW